MRAFQTAGGLAALLFAGALAGCASGGAGRGGPVAEVAPPLRAAGPDDRDASTYGLFLAGQAALGMGETSEAAVYLARASASQPDDAGLRERAFTANLIAGRVDEAAAFAPEVRPGDTGALASLGALVVGVSDLASGRGKEAAAAFGPGGAISGPNASAAGILLPWAQLAAGLPMTPPDAVAKPGDFAAQRGLALNRARLFERTGHPHEAEAAFRAAVERDPGRTDAAIALGGFLERQGRRADAVRAYDAALAKSPSDPALAAARARASTGGAAPAEPTLAEAAGEALVAPAEGFGARRQPEIGMIYLRLALRLNPTLAPAWLAVGDALQTSGDTPDAVFAWRQVRPDQPEHAEAAGRLAVALQERGDKPAALTLAADAARSAPDDTAVQVVYAELLRDGERYPEAIAVADRLVAALPPGAKGREAARLYFLRGTLRERAGQWPAAEADLKAAVALQPDNAEMLNYLGFAWADRGEHLTEALAMLEKAAAAQPDDGAIADSVGWARFRMGDVKGAVRDLERAVTLAPADPDVNEHLGDAYARSGRRVEALYQWRRVLTLDPDAKQRASVTAKLRQAAPASPA